MKFISIVTILLSLILPALKPALSQNYRAINFNGEYMYYDSSSMDLISIRIDSVAMLNSDLYFYNFKQLQQTDFGCYELAGSWLGDEVIEKPDGTFIFSIYPLSPSDSSDNFRILTRTPVGTSWTFYSYHSVNEHIEAVVKSIEKMSFLGLTDSVKMISLTRKNASGQVIPDPLNTEHILLSKNYGLVRLPKFDTFTDVPIFYNLAGMSNPETGITNLTTLKVFDYQPGDEFHTVLHDEGFTYYSIKYTCSSIFRVLERIDVTNQSVTYKMDRCSSSYYWASDTSFSYTYIHDTINQNYTAEPNSLLEGEPLEMVYYMSDYWKVTPHMGFLDSPYIPITGLPYKSYNSLEAWEYNGNCYAHLMIDGCYMENYFFKGLGGPYYDCEDFGYGHFYNHLNYYKKGNIEWGTPLSCDSLLHVGIHEHDKLSSIRTYPNPTTGILNIDIPLIPGYDLPEFELLDISGRKIYAEVIHSSHTQIDLTGFSSGIYLYQINNKSGNIRYSGKITR